MSLPLQTMHVYRNGILVGRTSISSGSKGHQTPTGVFTILEKKQTHRSKKYNDAPMPNMQRLTWSGIAMHSGNLPGHMGRFQASLAKFEPASEGQKILHAETLRAFNLLIQARRARLDAATTSLPGVMWAVIVVGAFISLSAAFFFKVEDVRLHGILFTLLSIFIGLVIFMIVALDRPFRGDLGLRPEPYPLIYDQLMKG